MYVRDLATEFDDFLVDLWGVIHDGEAPYEGVVEALERLAACDDKRVLFLTNTSRTREHVIETLLGMGIERRLFFDVVSSGDVTRQALLTRDPAIFAALPPSPQCLHIGDPAYVPWLFELGLSMTREAANADLVVATGVPAGGLEAARTTLGPLAERDVPLVGTNPDRRVPNRTGEVLGPGAVAAAYADLGGRVFLFGKPHAPIYEAARRRLGAIARRVVAIGDLPETDIRGARAAGIPSVLVGKMDAGADAPDMRIDAFRF